jgi:hypothetical protein
VVKRRKDQCFENNIFPHSQGIHVAGEPVRVIYMYLPELDVHGSALANGC